MLGDSLNAPADDETHALRDRDLPDRDFVFPMPVGVEQEALFVQMAE
jgi:hypothetical protein